MVRKCLMSDCNFTIVSVKWGFWCNNATITMKLIPSGLPVTLVLGNNGQQFQPHKCSFFLLLFSLFFTSPLPSNLLTIILRFAFPQHLGQYVNRAAYQGGHGGSNCFLLLLCLPPSNVGLNQTVLGLQQLKVRKYSKTDTLQMQKKLKSNPHGSEHFQIDC